MIVAFSVQASGLVVQGKGIHDPAQPRLSRLSAIIADRDYQERGRFCSLIIPDGWTLTAQAQQLNGATTEECERYGMRPLVALAQLNEWLAKSRVVIAHNLTFEKAIVDREMALINPSDPGLNRTRLRTICTTKTGTALMEDGRYPGLDMLYEMLTGTPYVASADGLSTPRATLEIFRRLVKMKMIDL